MNGATHGALDEQMQQVRRDLDELAAQVEAGEIDAATADRLADTYRAELDDLEAQEEAASRTGGPDGEGLPATITRSGRRMLVGAGILVGALALTVGVVGSFAQQREEGPLEGVAAVGGDLSQVSNETMEAVIASFRDEADPAIAAQIPRMELALAERYFEARTYDKAFDHYGAVIENPDSPPDVVSTSLTRVGWLVWLLNGEVDLAISTVDRALEVNPDNTEAVYVKGQLLWCGRGDAVDATALFEQVLATPGLPDDVVEQVGVDLERAAAGEACA